MAIHDPSGDMGNDIASKIQRMEELRPEQEAQFDQNISDYMVRNQLIPDRLSFIRRVYGILGFLLALSFLVSWPFIRDPQGALNAVTLGSYRWMSDVATFCIVVQLLFYMSVLVALALRFYGLFAVYLKMMTQWVLVSILYSIVYASSFALIIASTLATYEVVEILYFYMFTAITVLVLFGYTFLKKADFKDLYAYLVPFAMAVIYRIILAVFYSEQTAGWKGYLWSFACILSFFFGWTIVFDTQLIFGEKPLRGRKYPYMTSMYMFAAHEMNFDFVYLFLQSLGLFPGPTSEDAMLTAKPGN